MPAQAYEGYYRDKLKKGTTLILGAIQRMKHELRRGPQSTVTMGTTAATDIWKMTVSHLEQFAAEDESLA